MDEAPAEEVAAAEVTAEVVVEEAGDISLLPKMLNCFDFHLRQLWSEGVIAFWAANETLASVWAAVHVPSSRRELAGGRH